MKRHQSPDTILARIAADNADDLLRWRHHEDCAWGIVFGAYSALARISSDRDRVRLDAVYRRWDEFRTVVAKSWRNPDAAKELRP